MINKNKKEKIKFFLSDLFKKSNIEKFEYIDLDDDDINFFVSPRLTNKNIKNDINLNLLIYCSGLKSLTVYCPKIYKLQNNDSAMFTLNAINETNSTISLGKIYLNRVNNSVISYVNQIIFNDITTDLSPAMMNEYLEAFLFCSIKFYEQMKKEVKHG